MKLTFSPASPFARKVRIAAIETGLIDKIEFLPTTVAPGQPNDDYARITPLKKLPALILDHVLRDPTAVGAAVTIVALPCAIASTGLYALALKRLRAAGA